MPATVAVPPPRRSLETDRYWRVVRSRPAKPPRLLYKYRSSGLAVQMLESQELWFSPPAAFPDPHDCGVNPTWNLHEDETRQWFWSLVEQSLRDPQCWPEATSRRRRADLFAEIERLNRMTVDARRSYLAAQQRHLEADSRDRFERSRVRFADFRQRLRIWCGTSDPASDAMWKAFGEGGRGVALAFDSARLEDHWKRPFQQVFYTDDTPTFFSTHDWLKRAWYDLPRRSPAGESDEFHKFYLWKRAEFAFEREWRLTWLDERGAKECAMGFRFPPKSLTEVVVGPATDPDVAARIESLARRINARVRLKRA